MKKTAVETIKELQKASNEYPSVLPFLGAVLELNERIAALANLQKMFSMILLSAGADAEKLTRLFHTFKTLLN
jgi:hypothetical protein